LRPQLKNFALIIIGLPIARPKKSKPKRATKPNTLAQLAKAVGVSKRTLEDYFSRGCPRDSVAAIQRWRSENLASPKRRSPSPADPAGEEQPAQRSLASLMLDKAREEVRAKKLKNDQTEGLLLRRDDVERVFAELVLRIKSRVQVFPDEVEMLLPADVRDAAKRDLEDKVFLMLKEMAAWQLPA
jgi:hypothetical protein